MQGLAPILRAILPACYLAASWTWVIGMWLPVNLTTDFGWPAWVVFAVPNVIGATLVGFIHRPRRHNAPPPAQSFFETHRSAIHWFSFVTIALQLFFCGVLAREQLTFFSIGPIGGVSASMVGVVTLALVIALLPIRRAMMAAALVLLASVGLAFFAAQATGNAQTFVLPPLHGERTQTTYLPLIFMAPAIIIGFLTCPHLDATILRIRRDANDPSGLYAFILGFFGFFLLMIMMTLGYAGSMSYAKTGLMSVYIVGHILLQAAFTMGIHARAMVKGGAFKKCDTITHDVRPARRRIAFALFTLTLMPMLGTAAQDMRLPFTRADYPSSRLIYETFMGAYSIVFPAYLWICAMPKTPAARLDRKQRLTGFALACAFGLPGLALGAIWHIDWGIPLGVGAIVAMPWLLPKSQAKRAPKPVIT